LEEKGRPTVLQVRKQIREQVLRDDANVRLYMLVKHQSRRDGRFVLSAPTQALSPCDDGTTVGPSNRSRHLKAGE
jgi:hypothetical protein